MTDDWQVVEAAFTQLGWNMTPVHMLRARELELKELLAKIQTHTRFSEMQDGDMWFTKVAVALAE